VSFISTIGAVNKDMVLPFWWLGLARTFVTSALVAAAWFILQIVAQH